MKKSFLLKGKKILIATLTIAMMMAGMIGCGAAKDSNSETAENTSAEEKHTNADAENTSAEEKHTNADVENTSADQDSTGVNSESTGVDIDSNYADALFDTNYIHEVNISISEEDWNEILADPISKPKEYVTATIDGESYENVRFSPKGNASLFLVAADTSSERYSFKLTFNKKNKDQTYHGLDQFVLNNSFQDPSYLRDYACAWVFQQLDIPTALMSFVRLSINGEFYGVYMAAETESSSFVDRVFDGQGTLYKPESEVLTKHDGEEKARIKAAIEDGTIEEYMKNRKRINLPSDYETPGADLKYTDDDPDSYSDILENNVTDMDDDSGEKLITALKNLSEGNYDKAIDTSEVVRYFAAQNFVCNSDTYPSTMLHNYMLYENDGILSMIPWDYNVSMKPVRQVTGGTDSTSWTEIINMGIDSPTYQEVSLENRPMLGWIFKDKDAYAEYDESLENVIKSIESGAFEEEMKRMYEQIRPYVAEDPTAFCTLEEFDASYDDVINFCKLRAQSIQKQLDGDLARVTSDQDPAAQVTYK